MAQQMRVIETRLTWVAVLASVLGWGAGSALGLDPRKAVAQYTRERWGTDEGLPSASIADILQTRDGYLWLATARGLVRFDGVRFTVFDDVNTEGIASSRILALCEGRDGTLWAGTLGGLVRMKDGRFSSFTEMDGLSNNVVLSVHEDRSGIVWAGTYGGGLNRLRNDRFEVLTVKDGMPDDRISSIYEDPGGEIWVGTGGGLARLRGAMLSSYAKAEGLSDEKVWAICGDHNGVVWIGTRQGGLNRLKDGKISSYSANGGLASNFVTSLCADREGGLWIGTTRGGVHRLRDGVIERTKEEEGHSDETVTAIYEDREGSLWIGTDGGGLKQLKDGLFTSFTPRDGLSSDLPTSVYEDHTGVLWIGTDGGGLNRCEDGGVMSFSTRNGLSHDVVTSTAEDRQGRLWIGTAGGGVNVLSGGKLKAYRVSDGLSNDLVRAVYVDRRDRVWVGTYGGGLSCMQGGAFRTYTTKDGLPSDLVMAIYEDRQEDLWIGTYGGGVCRLKDGLFTTYTVKSGLPGNVVVAFHEDGSGHLWIGTYDGGVARFDRDRFTKCTRKNGLFDDDVFQILGDEAGNLWMSSGTGVFRVREKELNDFADGKILSVSCLSYGEADGMISRECRGAFNPAGCRAKDGKLWFPTTEGVVCVDPRSARRARLQPPVLIEEITVDNRTVRPDEPAAFPPGNRNLEFHFTALSLLAPEKTAFRYRLAGFDADWIEAGTRRIAYYTNIPPGAYRFEVAARGQDGRWSIDPAGYGFRVPPRFYHSHWFYATLALLSLLLGWTLHRFRVKLMASRVAVLNERNRIAREIHDTLGQQLAGVVTHLEAAKCVIGGSPEKARAYVERACALAREGIEEARRSIWALRPRTLEESDLPRALAVLARRIAEGTNAKVQVCVTGDCTGLSEEVEISLLRAAQEAATNAVKHAKAEEIHLELAYAADHVVLKVRDDGRGFENRDPRDSHGSGFGLVGMRERIEGLRGRMSVSSAPGAGTEIFISVPVAPRASMLRRWLARKPAAHGSVT